MPLQTYMLSDWSKSTNSWIMVWQNCWFLPLLCSTPHLLFDCLFCRIVLLQWFVTALTSCLGEPFRFALLRSSCLIVWWQSFDTDLFWKYTDPIKTHFTINTNLYRPNYSEIQTHLEYYHFYCVMACAILRNHSYSLQTPIRPPLPLPLTRIFQN